MLYLNERHIIELGFQWKEVSQTVVDTLKLLHSGEYVQPLKPYLRFNDLTNRIIAMPAYVGGEINASGLKWIASFPNNLQKGVPRAHSVTILNDTLTGKPICCINATLISGIRTAAVSGVMIDEYLRWKKSKKKGLCVGITGFGPIGQLHLGMILSLFGEHIQQVLLYDIRKIDESVINSLWLPKTKICSTWQEVFTDSDIFVSCTVSNSAYVDIPPTKGSLILNVSLRDFQPMCRPFMDYIIVDDWNEVCRENTDIEKMHKLYGLSKDETYSLADAVLTDKISRSISEDSTVMFNPMGMAIFDIAVGKHYFQNAESKSVGTILD